MSHTEQPSSLKKLGGLYISVSTFDMMQPDWILFLFSANSEEMVPSVTEGVEQWECSFEVSSGEPRA